MERARQLATDLVWGITHPVGALEGFKEGVHSCIEKPAYYVAEEILLSPIGSLLKFINPSPARSWRHPLGFPPLHVVANVSVLALALFNLGVVASGYAIGRLGLSLFDKSITVVQYFFMPLRGLQRLEGQMQRLADAGCRGVDEIAQRCLRFFQQLHRLGEQLSKLPLFGRVVSQSLGFACRTIANLAIYLNRGLSYSTQKGICLVGFIVQMPFFLIRKTAEALLSAGTGVGGRLYHYFVQIPGNALCHKLFKARPLPHYNRYDALAAWLLRWQNLESALQKAVELPFAEACEAYAFILEHHPKATNFEVCKRLFLSVKKEEAELQQSRREAPPKKYPFVGSLRGALDSRCWRNCKSFLSVTYLMTGFKTESTIGTLWSICEAATADPNSPYHQQCANMVP